VPDLDFDLSASNVNGQLVKVDPQMIKMKDEFYGLIAKGLGLDEGQMSMSSKAGNYLMCFQDKENITFCTHRNKSKQFPKNFRSAEGNICKVKHVMISVDDSEEKMIFLVKMTLHERDERPKLVSYLTSTAKTI